MITTRVGASEGDTKVLVGPILCELEYGCGYDAVHPQCLNWITNGRAKQNARIYLKPYFYY